jgi:hypothetical protein
LLEGVCKLDVVIEEKDALDVKTRGGFGVRHWGGKVAMGGERARNLNRERKGNFEQKEAKVAKGGGRRRFRVMLSERGGR